MKGKIFIAAALAVFANAQDCDFKKSVDVAETALGMTSVMKGPVKYIEKKSGEPEEMHATVAKRSRPIKSGEFAGLTQNNVYIVNACKVDWALVMKVDGSGSTVASAKAFFRDDGSLQAMCSGGAETEMYIAMPFNGAVEPNTGCTCFDEKSLRKGYSKVYGCMDPDQYVAAKKAAMDSQTILQ